MPPFSVCLASAEVAPFAKTGGLADVAAALAGALHRRGHDVRLFLPFYRRIAEQAPPLTPVPGLQDVRLEFGPHRPSFSVFQTPLPGSGCPVYLVHNAELYDRPGIYTHQGDEHLRFTFFSRAILESCQRMRWSPDVVHCNDWHTAVMPLMVRSLEWDRLFARTRTILTIHNIGYQGTFDAGSLADVGLHSLRHHLHQDDLRQGFVNLLKTGVLYAHAITTVSETYAREIMTHEYGVGLAPYLVRRREVLFGIVNGVDYAEWDPSTDARIPANYSAEDLSGKRVCKARLLAEMGLAPADASVPVVGMVARLTAQKGIPLLFQPLPHFLRQRDLRVVILGSGNPAYENDFRGLQGMFPGRVSYFEGYHNDLAHWIEAGSDLFLMPSLYEPCGLNQMYSLRYGTPPVVRRTGGLADTVQDLDVRRGTGTGFVFQEYTPDAFAGALGRGLVAFQQDDVFRALMLRGMRQDFSWERQVLRYERLYQMLTGAASRAASG